MRVYAIGDVHGYLSELRRAHDLIDADRVREREAGDEAPVVHLGDLVDRGPDSSGVIDFILDGRQVGREWIVLKGNHDRLFARYLRTGNGTDGRLRSPLTWISGPMGGEKTLASYGVARKTLGAKAPSCPRRRGCSEAHIAFMERLPLTYSRARSFSSTRGLTRCIDCRSERGRPCWIGTHSLGHDGPSLACCTRAYPGRRGNALRQPREPGYRRRLWTPNHAAVFENEEVWVLTDKGREPLQSPY